MEQDLVVSINPATETRSFGTVVAGPYRLRIVNVEKKVGKDSGQPYLNWQIELADPTIKASDGKSSVGAIFYMTTLQHEKQWNLKALVVGCGLPWEGDSLDARSLLGLEFDAVLKVAKQQNGEDRNEIQKILPKA